MRTISYSLKPNVVYHFTLHAVDDVFSYEPLPAVQAIVAESIEQAATHYPIAIHCAGASCSLFEILFSLTDVEKTNVRPFFEYLLDILENEFRCFWSSIPEPLFRDMQILRCRSDYEAEQKLFEITCRPVSHGLVPRVADWRGYTTYRQLIGKQ